MSSSGMSVSRLLPNFRLCHLLILFVHFLRFLFILFKKSHCTMCMNSRCFICGFMIYEHLFRLNMKIKWYPYSYNTTLLFPFLFSLYPDLLQHCNHPAPCSQHRTLVVSSWIKPTDRCSYLSIRLQSQRIRDWTY